MRAHFGFNNQPRSESYVDRTILGYCSLSDIFQDVEIGQVRNTPRSLPTRPQKVMIIESPATCFTGREMRIPYATLTPGLMSRIDLPGPKSFFVPSASQLKVIDAEWETREGRCLITMSAYYAVRRYNTWEPNQDFRFDYWVGFVTCKDRDRFFCDLQVPTLDAAAA